MREIKFRGQQVDTKEWIYGGLVEWIDNCTIYIDAPSPKRSFIYQYNDRGCLQTLTTYAEIIPETLGQFTRLLDKNGKEIYEGDILKRSWENNQESDKCIVKYGRYNCSCCTGVYGWYFDDDDIRDIDHFNNFEVIGTIHDKEIE